MGDRANIVVRDRYAKRDSEAVWLYSHWGGTEMPETLRQALAHRERWDDEPYLARIVLQTMIAGDQSATGYGISTRMPDNEYDLLVLADERVYRVPENGYRADGNWAELAKYPSISFEDYIAADERTWDNLLDVLP